MWKTQPIHVHNSLPKVKFLQPDNCIHLDFSPTSAVTPSLDTPTPSTSKNILTITLDPDSDHVAQTFQPDSQQVNPISQLVNK